MSPSRTVLIPGAGRGIGLATAERLAAAGWDVIAGVRSEADADRVATQVGARTVQLDITSTDDVARLPELVGPLDALVNNAGVVVSGPVEGVPLERLRWQLEVNVVGQVAVTQALLPALRRSGGRIVFVSSVSGRVATPMTGAYNASKFALEGLADALRMEVAPWGVRVSLVEPAQTATDMWGQAVERLEADLEPLTDEQRRLYADHIAGARKVVKVSQRMAVPAEDVAGAIEKALTDGRPRARYVVGLGPKVQAGLAAITPTPVLDAALRTASGIRGQGPEPDPA